jgi:uncharacterized protein (TIGR02217 family)
LSFHEVQFPTDISKGSSGGPERRTDIVTLRSGFEERNTIWANSRRRYDASFGLRSLDDLYQVIQFFEARSGKLHSFRWKDWMDYRSGSPVFTATSADQLIGVGTGALATFQLVKRYTSGGINWDRIIKKPVAGTVLVEVAGVLKTIGTQYTVDTTTGIVTFLAGNIPAPGQNVKAGFWFDVPVRFDTDFLNASIEAFEAGSVPSIDILEVRV